MNVMVSKVTKGNLRTRKEKRRKVSNGPVSTNR